MTTFKRLLPCEILRANRLAAKPEAKGLEKTAAELYNGAR